MALARKIEPSPTESFRAHVTVPEEVRDIFAWLVKYEPKFLGSPAAVAAELIRVGAHALYADSCKAAEPLDEEIADAMGDYQSTSLARSVKGDE
jgi:hypothetical protein